MNRRVSNKIFKGASIFAVILCCALLFFLLGVIFWNGFSAISFDFIFSSSSNFGAEGGIIFQIIGSLLLIIVAGVISFPIALGAAIFKSEYTKSKSWSKISSMIIYGLNAIPSVIYGIFGLLFFVNFLDTGISWYVGSIILAIMILPTVIFAAYQSINSVPTSFRDSSLALGFTKWQMIYKVLLPQGINGAVTGLLIGLARAIGETAPIMFIATAFSGVEFPGSLVEPVASIPTHILSLAQQATNPDALQNAWGASLMLILLVISFSTSALFLRLKMKKN